mmetsp:Transcript_28923/g.63985  ORF Transcript_28923/g.63985 Transcript_28923/m.63985 type:complete len:211 (-) Transcript_28923:150-782(-)
MMTSSIFFINLYFLSSCLFAYEAPQGPLPMHPLHGDPVWHDPAHLLVLQVVVSLVGGESPLGRDVHLLPASELVLGPAEGLYRNLHLLILGADGHEHLPDVDSGSGAVWLAERTTHACGQAICSGAGQCLVDSQDLIWVRSDSDVKEVPASVLDHVLVAGNACGLEGLACDLLTLITNHVHGCWELVARDFLPAGIIDAQLCIWNTPTEP